MQTTPLVEVSEPWWKRWQNIQTHLYISFGLRVLLMAYGDYQVHVVNITRMFNNYVKM